MTTDVHRERVGVKAIALFVAVFCANGALGSQTALISPFVRELGGEASTAGLAAGIYPAALMLWLSPFTSLAQRYSRRLIYTVASVIFAAGFFLSATVTTPAQLSLYRLIQAIGGAYVFMLGSEVPRYFQPGRTAFAMALFSVVLGTGGFIGSSASGYLAAAFGYRAALRVAGTMAGLAIIALPLGLLKRASSADNPTGSGFLSVIRVPNILAVCASLFVVLLCYHTVLILVPLQVLDLGFPQQQIGLIVGSAQIAYALTQLPAGSLSDRYGRKPLMVIKSTLPPLALLLLAHLPYVLDVPLVPLVIGLTLFTGAGLAIGTPAMYALVIESAPTEEDVPTAMSLLFTALLAPGVLMSPIGKLADLRGFTLAFTIVSAVGFTGAITAALFLKETLKK